MYITKERTTELKGIAIICVLLGHIFGQYNVNSLSVLGSVGVTIFLFISGYGLTILNTKSTKLLVALKPV
ncbi:acyltransferase family protein [Clostridium tertium]